MFILPSISAGVPRLDFTIIMVFPKHPLPHKMFGIFPHTTLVPDLPLLEDLMSGLWRLIPATPPFCGKILKSILAGILAESEEAGIYIVGRKRTSSFFVTGHSEYDRDTLATEYFRDVNLGLPIQVPKYYFPSDDPQKNAVTYLARTCQSSFFQLAQLFLSIRALPLTFQRLKRDIIRRNFYRQRAIPSAFYIYSKWGDHDGAVATRFWACPLPAAGKFFGTEPHSASNLQLFLYLLPAGPYQSYDRQPPGVFIRWKKSSENSNCILRMRINLTSLPLSGRENLPFTLGWGN